MFFSMPQRILSMEYARIGVQLMSEAMVIIGVAAMLISPPISAIEVGEREWDGHSLEDGWALFGIDRVGRLKHRPEQVLDVLLALPLTITLFIYGLLRLQAEVRFGDWGLQGVGLKKKLAVRQSKSPGRSCPKSRPRISNQPRSNVQTSDSSLSLTMTAKVKGPPRRKAWTGLFSA